MLYVSVWINQASSDGHFELSGMQ